jgi:hypothetical protein
MANGRFWRSVKEVACVQTAGNSRLTGTAGKSARLAGASLGCDREASHPALAMSKQRVQAANLRRATAPDSCSSGAPHCSGSGTRSSLWPCRRRPAKRTAIEAHRHADQRRYDPALFQTADEGAPQARQIADRFHILQNLREAVQAQLGRTVGSSARPSLPADVDDEREAMISRSARDKHRGAEHRCLTRIASQRSRQDNECAGRREVRSSCSRSALPL